MTLSVFVIRKSTFDGGVAVAVGVAVVVMVAVVVGTIRGVLVDVDATRLGLGLGVFVNMGINVLVEVGFKVCVGQGGGVLVFGGMWVNVLVGRGVLVVKDAPGVRKTSSQTGLVRMEGSRGSMKLTGRLVRKSLLGLRFEFILANNLQLGGKRNAHPLARMMQMNPNSRIRVMIMT